MAPWMRLKSEHNLVVVTADSLVVRSLQLVFRPLPWVGSGCWCEILNNQDVCREGIFGNYTEVWKRLTHSQEMNFASISKAAMAAGSVLNDVKSKAKDAIQDSGVVANMRQTAMEVAGMASTNSEDDPLPELRKHTKLDAQFRALYKKTDVYLRAASAMCEASKALAEELSDAANEELYGCAGVAAAQMDAAHHLAMHTHMQALGQTLHRKVFTPIRKEVEDRKDIDKRIADRRKVRYPECRRSLYWPGCARWRKGAERQADGRWQAHQQKRLLSRRDESILSMLDLISSASCDHGIRCARTTMHTGGSSSAWSRPTPTTAKCTRPPLTIFPARSGPSPRPEDPPFVSGHPEQTNLSHHGRHLEPWQV